MKMEKLSDIARDYLDDLDVLAEARREFEENLAKWWDEIVRHDLERLLKEQFGGPINIWDIKSNPGEAWCRISNNQAMAAVLTDPRRSNRPFYTVSLYVGSQTDLRKLRDDETLRQRFDQEGSEQKVCGATGLNWKDTKLATVDIKILPDAPDETCKKVCDTVSRYFRLVTTHHRLKRGIK
jgi:hypothetical protein